jgi:hypothetical protein
MSRTTRKPAFAVEYSRESWIKREVAYHARRPYTHVKVYFTEEENAAYYARQVAEYEERCKAARRDYWWYLENEDRWNEFAERRYLAAIGHPPVRRSWCRHVQVKRPVEAAIAEANAYYDRVTRDGWAGETTRRSGYKHATARSLRLENRRFCHRVVTDGNWEDVAYPSRKEGKQKIWDWW